ncbi:MAG: small multi-drug export protein [Archaeoglobaceae archaeon]
MVPVEVIVVSVLPISELRGGIPLALYYGLDPLSAYVVCVLSNLLPVPFLLYALEKLEGLISSLPIVGELYRYIVHRVEKRKGLVEAYGYLGLAAFVAVPLPVTGAWTGSLLAFLLRLEKGRTFASISLGVATAGAVVTLATLGIFNLSSLLRVL